MTDDDLRSRLRRADPAASLPPIAPDHVSRLLGETMTTTVPTYTAGRRRFAALAAAALVLIIAGSGWFVTRPDEPGTPKAGALVASTPASGPATTIALAGAAAKCREPQAEQLATNADLAFAGTVTGISDNVVSLTVTKVYRGAAFTQVKVAQAGDTSEQLLGSGKFEIGKDYLVASAQGDVMICGYSGEADPGLQELYDKAF